MRRAIAAATAGLLLGLPAAAPAHITLQPDSVPAGGFVRLDVRVPNERDDTGTVKVDMKLPPGFVSVAYEPVPGWSVSVQREQLEEPIEIEGLELDEQIARITWRGDGELGIIRPGEFQDFGVSLGIPDGKAGDELAFKLLQVYQGGEVVRWIGPPDSETPAPTVALTAAAEGGGHGAPSTAAPAAGESAAPPVARAAADLESGSDALAIAALILGGLGLAAGVAALVFARRARANATKGPSS